MNKVNILFLFILLLFPSFGKAQSTNAPLNDDYYQLLERYEIKQNHFSGQYHSSFRAIQRKAIAEFAAQQLDSLLQLTETDRFNLQFFASDNWEWTSKADVKNKPLLKYFFRHKPDFYNVEREDFDLHLNPVLYLGGGTEAGNARPYINSRGFELRARIDKKVSFYTFFTENQARFPAYVRERTDRNNTLPGEGFYKAYKEGGVDFFHARAYVSFNPLKFLYLQFGQDRFFIGNGQRSLILSDFGNTYPFLKLQTQIGKWRYTNLFAQLRGNFPGRASNETEIKKILSLHHLSLNVTNNLNIGFFEAVISGSKNRTGSFQPEVFIPVIFLGRIGNFAGNRTSNGLSGVDAKWNFLRHFQLYTQIVIDDFMLSQLKEGNGWWGNKWAVQTGGKYINAFGISQLDLQLEWNRARPFTYTHSSGYTSYTHYYQPLAHPLGANFDEQIFILRYQPLKRLLIEAQYLHAVYGTDSLRSNVGGNLLLSHTTREGDFDHKIGQGVKTNLKMANISFTYMPAHRLYIDLNQTVRRLTTYSFPEEKNLITTLGIRWNIGRRGHLF